MKKLFSVSILLCLCLVVQPIFANKLHAQQDSSLIWLKKNGRWIAIGAGAIVVLTATIIAAKKAKKFEKKEHARLTLEGKNITAINIKNSDPSEFQKPGQKLLFQLEAITDGPALRTFGSGDTPVEDWEIDYGGLKKGTSPDEVIVPSETENVKDSYTITAKSRFGNGPKGILTLKIAKPVRLDIRPMPTVFYAGVSIPGKIGIVYSDSSFVTDSKIARSIKLDYASESADILGDFGKKMGLPVPSGNLKMALISPDLPDLKREILLKQDFGGTYSYIYNGGWGSSGAQGARGNDCGTNSRPTNGKNGGKGGNGRDAYEVEVFVDVYPGLVGGKQFCIAKMVSSYEEDSYRVFDPSTSELKIYATGGSGGSGGIGGNGGGCNIMVDGIKRDNEFGFGADGGDGGDGGNGGKITVTISPEAKKLEPKMELLNGGGSGGQKGSPGFSGGSGHPNGNWGRTGQSGQSGPEPKIIVAPVSIEVPK